MGINWTILRWIGGSQTTFTCNKIPLKAQRPRWAEIGCWILKFHRSRPKGPSLKQIPSGCMQVYTLCLDSYSCLQRCEALGQSHQCRRRSSCCWCSLQTPWTAAGSWADRAEGTTNRLLPVSACQGETVCVFAEREETKKGLKRSFSHSVRFWGGEKLTVNLITLEHWHPGKWSWCLFPLLP